MIKSYITIKEKKTEYFYRENKINNNVIVFLNGLNACPNVIDSFKHKIFNENYLVTFDNIAHGNNPEKHTSSYKKILKYTIDVIKNLKKEEKFINKKFIIIGESLGAILCYLISLKNNSLSDLYFCWNAPTKIANTKIGFKKKKLIIIKTLFTYLTNIETYTKGIFDENTTSNEAVIRINRITPKRYVSTKLTLATWRSMRYIKKIFKKNILIKNCFYIQSLEDIMCNQKIFLKINNDNFFIFKKGKHLLSFEKESKELFNLLQDKINKNCI